MAKRRAKSGNQRLIGERARELATPVVRVVTAVLVLGTFAVVATRLAAMARENPRFLVDPATVMDEVRPDWMPAGIVEEIRADLHRIEPLSVFDLDFADRLRAEVAGASPWIAAVHQVERLFPNRAVVELELRKPVASVEWGGDRFILDRQGRVVRREARRSPASFGVTVLPVLGSRPDHTPRVGLEFADPEVLAAALVAGELADLNEPGRRYLRAIEPVALEVRRSVRGSTTAAGEVHLRTASGVLVEWGRARRSGQYGLADPTPERKIDHLARILEEFPGLVGLEEARLNFDYPLFRPAGGAIGFLDGPADSDGLSGSTERRSDS